MPKTNSRTYTPRQPRNQGRMDSCNGAGWYRITRSGQGPQFCFSHNQRLRALADRLEGRYGDLCPGVVLFLGKKRRATAASELHIPQDNSLRLNAATIHEWHDLGTAFPVFAAQMTLEETFAQVDSQQPPPFCGCHQDVSYSIPWACDTKSGGIHDRFLIHAILPFVSVVLWFVDDYESKEIKSTFDKWHAIAPHVSGINPQLLLIGTSSKLLYSIAALSGQLFHSAAVLDLQKRPLSFAIILDHVALDRRVRTAQDRLFSAVHLARLHEMVAKQVAEEQGSALSLFQMTKRSYSQHTHGKFLQDFVLLASTAQLPLPETIMHIASTIALHAWPPGSHRFSADDVFESLYKPAVLAAFHGLGEEMSQLKSAEVKSALCDRRAQLSFHITPRPSFDLHCQWIRGLRTFRSVHANLLCLFCLMRASQHPLLCGHTLCDVCVMSLGDQSTGEYCYAIRECIFCSQTVGFQRSLKPPTCGIRALSLDGGGIRGVISLENILLLQADLARASKLRFLDLFDLVVATSAGGLHALAFYPRGLNEGTWSAEFDKVVKDTIHAHAGTSEAFLKHVKRAVRFWSQDGIYDTATLEKLFQRAYGPKRKFFAWTHNGHIPKIAITATSISKKPETYLFTNYNVETHRSRNGKMRLDYRYAPRHPLHDGEPLVWQIARATSAAPLVFPTIEIGGISYQDGGIRSYNNPVALCDTEIWQIWGESQSYDVLVSLGTGYEDNDGTSPKFRGRWRHGFTPRIYDNIITMNDNHETHAKYAARLPHAKKGNYFRVDLKLHKLPRMNDENEMDTLRQLVRRHEVGEQQRKEISMALLIASFFFELDHEPVLMNALYHCHGTIRCRVPLLSIIAFFQAYEGDFAEFSLKLGHAYDDVTLANIKVRASEDGSPDLQSYLCGTCKRFQIPVQFFVHHPNAEVSVRLKVGSTKRGISGFPHSMAWFAKQQHLDDAVFGRDDHAIPSTTICRACTPQILKRSPTSSRLGSTRRPRKVAKQI